MIENTLISIAMATYNGEKFLSQQLDSILVQTYTNLEIIICDDCSTDATCHILEQYCNMDARIKFFKNEYNLGLVKNFERTFSFCSGEYIALCDQDDIWLPNKIEVLLQNIKNCDLVHSDAILIDDENSTIQKSFSSYANKDSSKDFLDYMFSNNVTGCTAMFKKSLLYDNLPFPNSVHVHDWWLAILAAKKSCIAYVDEPLVLYRQHNNNQIGATSAYYIPAYEKRAANLYKHLLLLKTVETYFSFNPLTSRFIHLLVQYYEDYFSKNFRIQSFIFYMMNFQRFHRQKPMSYRFAALFLSFFGCKIQKLLWPSRLLAWIAKR